VHPNRNSNTRWKYDIECSPNSGGLNDSTETVPDIDMAEECWRDTKGYQEIHGSNMQVPYSVSEKPGETRSDAESRRLKVICKRSGRDGPWKILPKYEGESAKQRAGSVVRQERGMSALLSTVSVTQDPGASRNQPTAAAPSAVQPAANVVSVADPLSAVGPRSTPTFLTTLPTSRSVLSNAPASSNTVSMAPEHPSRITFVFRGQDGSPMRQRSFIECRTVYKLFMHAKLGGLLLSKAPILVLKFRGSQKELKVGLDDEMDFTVVVGAIELDINNNGQSVIDVRVADA
jgi:hypothetical protein